MKCKIFDNMQTVNLRLTLCALVLGCCSVPALAQEDESEALSDSELAIKQPKRNTAAPTHPTVNIKGCVTDLATHKPLAGVQLQALGYERYTAMTEEDGTFIIKVPVFATSLYVHAPQYLAQQVAIVAGDSTQQVTVGMLSDKFSPMYGKGTVYTAQRSIDVQNYGETIDAEIANRLGGDMRTIQRSGMEDGGASMFIRGLNSISSTAQPLVVVDGVEQDMMRNRGSLHDGQFLNLLANIAPDDIAKVTVLKNATALYGARGANGVVLIETKRGHSMATRIDANISAGVNLIPQLPTVMNETQYRNYVTEMLGTVPGVESRNITWKFLMDHPYYYRTYNENNTDWTDEVYRTAMTQNYSVNVQGGDDIGMYNLSVGYMDADRTVKETNFNRMNVRFNTDIKITWNLETKFDLAISRTSNQLFDDGMPADLTAGAVVSPTGLALIKSPMVSPYQWNQTIGGFSELLSNYDDIFDQLGTSYSLANPSAIIAYSNGENKNKSENTYFNVRLEPTFRFNKQFTITSALAYNLMRNAQRYYRPINGVPTFEVPDLGPVTSKVMSMYATESNIMSNTHVDWKYQKDAHTMAAYIGFRYNYFSYDNSDLRTEYTTRQLTDKNPTLNSNYPANVDGVNDVWKNMMWYGNFDYNFMNRYFASVSLAAEANSRFGSNASAPKLFGTRWALFPSLQLGWVITNEAWFPKNVGINYLRLNAGFDMSGNDDISNYAARTSFTAVRFNSYLTGIQLTNIGNEDIQWETTTKWNVGLQANVLNNRVGVGFDYFIHKTDNLLTLKKFSTPVSGINRYWSNEGALENQGFEVNVTVKPIVSKDWNLEIGASVGHYKNKVTKLPEGYEPQSVYGESNILTQVGSPVALFYGYKTEGVFSNDAQASTAHTAADGSKTYLLMEDKAGNPVQFQAGDVHFVDQNGDGYISDGSDGRADDRVVIGDPNPDIYGNIFARLGWKNLTLTLGFNYSLGNDVYNYQRMILNSGSNFYNQQVKELSHWRYEGQQTDMPRIAFGDPMQNNRFSDRWIEDGSYLRLKTLNLTYQVPVPGSWTWLQGLSVWAEARNLVTLTRYTGSDPEFSIANSVYYQGIDCGNLAQGRAFTLGLKVNL